MSKKIPTAKYGYLEIPDPQHVLEEYARANGVEMSGDEIAISGATVVPLLRRDKTGLFAIGARKDDIIYALRRVGESAGCTNRPVYLGNGGP